MGANQSNKEHTIDYLTKIKNKMAKEIRRKNVEIEEANAKKLEYFFNSVGRANETKYLKKNPFHEQYKMQIDDAINKLSLGGKNSKWRFVGMSGRDFEIYLRDLINEIMEESKKLGATWKDMDSNPKTYVIDLGKKQVDMFKNIEDNIVKESVKFELKKTYASVSQKMKKFADEEKAVSHINATVQGKIDTALNLVDFEFNIDNPVLNEILPLLAESSFSDKAYLTTGDVYIGHTNSFRVFLATSGNMKAETKIAQWEAMLNCMDHHPKKHKPASAAMLFYQIRYMYELTGYGLKYVDDQINQALGNTFGARYFIYYNDKHITVHSTAKIIDDFIRAVEDEKYFQSHAEAYGEKEYALYASLKMRMIDEGNERRFEFGG